MVLHLLLSLLFFWSDTSTRIIYVNQANAPGGDGSTWALAYNNLQDALTTTIGLTNTQIWVAKGTYKPTLKYGGGYSGTEPNLVTFKLANNNVLYGGFAGTETSVSQRNLNTNPTILSGDITGAQNDRAWHVLTADSAVNVVVDSFIVEKGYAAGPDSGSVVVGAGGTSFISSITYAHALGAGLIAIHGADVTVNNVQFRDHTANSSRCTILTLNPPISALAAGGGGVGIAGSKVVITGSKLTNNLVTMFGTEGGAVNVIFEGELAMTGCIVTGNKGNRNGGAIHARDANKITCSSSTFTNNEVVGTSVGDEAGATIGAFNSDLTVTSCIFNSNKISSGVGPGGIFFHVPFDDGEAYKLTVTSCTFTNNIGTILGGAINIFGFVPNAGVSAEITSCVFTNNTGGTGGGIYIDSIPTKVTSCLFNNNKAGTSGGGIFASNFGNSIFNRTQLSTRSKTTITSSSFNGNTITNTNIGSPAFVLGFLAQVFSASAGQPPAGVSIVPIGGGGLSSEFGGNVDVISSIFTSNNAAPGQGGAILVGGSVGFSGGSPLGMNQAYLNVVSSMAANNNDQNGPNNVALLDPTGLGTTPNGVYFATDGSIV